jgi:parallel beta-helix repeat protein
MKNCFLGAILAVATFTTAATTQAAVHRVYPGESIQDAIDGASPGDTILVEPGEYGEIAEDGTETYGLRITTDNLRLIGKRNRGKGKANRVRLIAYGEQKTGVYVAPENCEYKMNEQECKTAGFGGGDIVPVKNFYIRGFVVEDFPDNGIQTRWVDGFEFVRNESANNGWVNGNGIYPTLSANGLVRNNVSYGSLDTAMWVAGSENVRVIGNELYGSVIGFEITVSNNVQVMHNEIYDNIVGVGLFHPNGAGNPPLPEMKNWVIKHNDIYDNNNTDIEAPPGSFQGLLPPGAGILLLGVSDHVVAKNNVEDNDFLGIGVLGWCTATDGTPENCAAKPPIDPVLGPQSPNADRNLIYKNYLSGNGENPPPVEDVPLAALASDIIYLQTPGLSEFFPDWESGVGESGNCFKKNRSDEELTFWSSEPFTMIQDPPEPTPAPPELGGILPTDGC